MNDDPFLVSKNGEVWACWLNGKPAVNLGSEQNFWMVAEKLFNELHPDERSESEISITDQQAGKTKEFAKPTQDHIERDEPRYDVTLDGRLYGTNGSRAVTIYDLSTRGCRVKDHTLANPGSLVTIKIGHVGPIAAVIRWRRGNFVGLKFESPMHPAVLDNIRQQESLR
ncbi:PilZ domain-containing protein [Erythrobacter westpacificensis]